MIDSPAVVHQQELKLLNIVDAEPARQTRCCRTSTLTRKGGSLLVEAIGQQAPRLLVVAIAGVNKQQVALEASAGAVVQAVGSAPGRLQNMLMSRLIRNDKHVKSLAQRQDSGKARYLV